MLRWILVAVALTGCDKVFGFDSIPAAPVDAAPDAFLGGTWREVTAGFSHTCAIRMDDTLWCWGRNDAGQLGIGTTDLEIDRPAQVPGMWKHVTTQYMTTCAIDTTDAMYCWGRNDVGQAGSDAAVTSSPNRIDDETWTDVTTGWFHSCGITSDGTAKCWGYNVNGELGTGDTTPSSTPRAIDTTLHFTHLDAGSSHTCAIGTTDQSLWCWGYGAYGQLGQGDGAAHASPVQVGTDAWLDVSGGETVTCGVLATGHLRCWGTGYHDELGNTTTISQLRPDIVGTDSGGWVDIEMAKEHACARKDDSSVWCWGENDLLQLANTNLPTDDPVPTPVPGGPAGWLGMATGYRTFCGVGSDRALWCMGLISDGALGDGTGSLTTPVQVMTGATQLASATNTTCAVGAANARFCWGENAQAQLGDGTKRTYDTPTHIGSGGMQLAIGTEDTCVLDTGSHLQCAGTSAYYEIDPMQVAHATPIEVSPALAPWSAVSVTNHTCGIRSTGALYCWGYGADGEIGDGFMVSQPNPTVVGSETWTSIATGDNHTCGVSASGVKCWGYGSYGELGDGLMTSHAAPGPVAITATTGTMYAAGAGSCLLSGGALACWGDNGLGALGTGVPNIDNMPLPVTGTYTELALGRRHSCAVAADQHLWCWGENSYGQLGDGTYTSAATPRQIGTLTWKHVAVGDFHSCGIQTDGTVWCWGADHVGQAGVPRVRQSFARLP